MRTAAVLSIVSMLLVSCQTISDPAPPPPPREQLAGTWFGFSRSAGYRLDLFENGHAALAAAYAVEQGRIRRYAADQWQLVGHDLSAVFVSVDADDRPLYFHARAGETGLSKISMSLSEANRVPAANEFLRESRVNHLLKILTQPAAVPSADETP